MLTQPTIEKLHALHLSAMAQAFEQQRGSAQHAELHFDDRFGLLVDAERTAREHRRLTQRLRHARLRYAAVFEDHSHAVLVVAVSNCEVASTLWRGRHLPVVAVGETDRIKRDTFVTDRVQSSRNVPQVSLQQRRSRPGDAFARQAAVIE